MLILQFHIYKSLNIFGIIYQKAYIIGFASTLSTQPSSASSKMVASLIACDVSEAMLHQGRGSSPSS